MAKAFKKGDTATLITSWDGKGAVVARRVTVQSCGVKRMTLTDTETGECLGCNFRPALGDVNEATRGWSGTFHATDESSVQALAIEAASRILAESRVRAAKRLADFVADPGPVLPQYQPKVKAELEAEVADLKARGPRILSPAEADAEVAAQVAAHKAARS